MIGASIRHDANLAWGWWLRTVSSPGWGVVIVDEDGREWQSVRQAFWAGRLGMSLDSEAVVNEGLELLLAMLASRSRDIVGPVETGAALFGGDPRFYRLWTYWLVSTGLAEAGRMRTPFEATVTHEGASVIRMLVATRPPELADIAIGKDAMALFGAQGSTTECDRERFDAAEAALRRFRFAVIREDLFGQHMVEMLHRDLRDPIPMVRTIWTVVCSDAGSRDRLHLWMHDRSDRWSAWGELVLQKGPHFLTQLLLELLNANAPSGPPTSGDRPTGTHLAIPNRS
jgi:hypothetical protein